VDQIADLIDIAQNKLHHMDADVELICPQGTCSTDLKIWKFHIPFSDL
jgi:hypothetical protein